MPTLRKWLDDRPDLTQEQFGRRVGEILGLPNGLTQGRISQIVKSGTTDAETALAIEEATKGQVTVREVLPQREAVA